MSLDRYLDRYLDISNNYFLGKSLHFDWQRTNESYFRAFARVGVLKAHWIFGNEEYRAVLFSQFYFFPRFSLNLKCVT